MTKAELRATYHLALAYAAVAVFIAFNVYDRAQINAHGRDLARAEAVVLAALMDAPVVVEPPMLEPPLLVGGR